jgi:3',5'-cyclic AMP phosphodiesterase CpdA
VTLKPKEILMNNRDFSQANGDGIDRRGFLECMTWVGTGVAWYVQGGVLRSEAFAQNAPPKEAADFTFVQISDSHIGFGKEPNRDVAGTLKVAVDRINALPKAPAFLLHTGDLTHLAKPDEFDTLAEVLKGARVNQKWFVPGEHDVFSDDAKAYRERIGKGTKGTGWYSFDYNGVHFVGLVNVLDLKAGGLGVLGKEQLDWLKKDLEGRGDSTPLVVFAHVPLWTVYEKWGWGTEDAAQALALMKRFGSVTVLNGHVHQAMQKVEGNVTFHTGRSTAFPQPEPGKADAPGPLKNVPADRLRRMLGLARVSVVKSKSSLATIDDTLE